MTSYRTNTVMLVAISPGDRGGNSVAHIEIFTTNMREPCLVQVETHNYV